MSTILSYPGIGFSMGRSRGREQRYDSAVAAVKASASHYEKGQLVAPNLLAAQVILACNPEKTDLAWLTQSVETMGGELETCSVRELKAKLRLHDRRVAAVVVFEKAGGSFSLQEIELARSCARETAFIRVSYGRELNEFTPDSRGLFDASLRAPLSRSAFTLGLSSALSNADFRLAV